MLRKSQGRFVVSLGIVAVAATALFAAGCGAKKSQGALVGWAIAGHPLVGATIKAVDDKGKVIATSPATSLRTGTWYLPLAGPPKTFTVVVSGGSDHGRPFKGELKNVIHDYDFKSPRAIHVNPATTLVSAYEGVHPDATGDQAVEAVSKFLRVPDPLDLESDLRVSDRFFSGVEFMKEATAAGGVGPFIDKLERDLEAGKTHPFPRAPSNQDGLGAALTPLQYLQGASAVVGITGSIVGMIRGQQEDAEISQIESQVSQIESQVADIQTDMNTVLTQLNSLVQQTGQNGYNAAISTNTNNLVTQLGIIYPLYQNLLQTATSSSITAVFNPYNPYDQSWVPPATPASPAQIEAAVTAFENAMQGNESLFDNAGGGGVFGIYSDLVKSGGQTGGLDEWATLAGTHTTRFITHATQVRAAYAIAYWLGIESEVLDVDGAYESAMNTDSSGKAITPAPVNMHWSEASKAFTGQVATDADSQCVASGGATGTSNDVLNELNASHSCFTALPDDTSSGPAYQANGLYPMTLVDQATGLMWEDGGGGNSDYYDSTNFVSDASQTGFPDPASVPSPGWALPSLSDYETLASEDQGGWDVRDQYSSTLDMLANYAQLPFFQNLVADTMDSTKSQPGDFNLAYWTNYGSCSEYLEYGIESLGPDCVAGAYYIGGTPKAFLLCANAASGSGDSQCVADMNVADRVSGTSDSAGYLYQDIFKSSHVYDSADYLLVRTPGSGEVYGGS
ncbi:MAG TPA: hypothetical protein VG652_10100 [Gaiellaceae bacterium]|nr:hypothetical protein [Gaiellaceae bacterium]